MKCCLLVGACMALFLAVQDTARAQFAPHAPHFALDCYTLEFDEDGSRYRGFSLTLDLEAGKYSYLMPAVSYDIVGIDGADIILKDDEFEMANGAAGYDRAAIRRFERDDGSAYYAYHARIRNDIRNDTHTLFCEVTGFVPLP